MIDDEIDDPDLPPDDTELLDPLDEEYDELGLGEHPLSVPSFSRREIDDLVDLTVAEELERLKNNPPKKD